MKAIVWTKYGPPEVLQLKEVEKPVPKENEVLVRVYATTVTAGDCELRSLSLPVYFGLPLRIMLGFRRPKDNTIPGTELAGEVEAVGQGVKRFKKGDHVFGSTGLALGTYAEYVCLPENGVLAAKPSTMTYDEAATVPFGGLDALYFLRKAHIRNGQQVLIVGAGGSIGTFGVQLAKDLGAEVTAVDSTGKLDMLRAIGADHVIDYTQEDFTRNGQTYDVLFDTVGKGSFSGNIRSLKKNGTYLCANPRPVHWVRGPWVSWTTGKKAIAGAADHKTEDLLFLKELVEAGKIKSAIDRRYPLEQIVEAHRYVETGQKKGNVVITVEHSSR